MPSRPLSFAATGKRDFRSLQFIQGEGAFDQVKVMELSRDPKTGAQALFVSLPKGAADLEGPHYHTTGAHNIILRGSVIGTVRGRRMRLGPGDYYRASGSVLCPGSRTDEGALIFMLTDGDYRAEPAKGGRAISKASAADDWKVMATRPSLASLRARRGTGTFAGVETAVVAVNTRTKGTVTYIRMPAGKHREPPHSHTSSAHTLVLSGAVTGHIGGKDVTLGQYDYFRQAAGVPCGGSQGDIGAEMVMFTDGPFDTM
jgi:quercetin dioxygenase-like cupin family protein